jgi:hypothetical protein
MTPNIYRAALSESVGAAPNFARSQGPRYGS